MGGRVALELVGDQPSGLAPLSLEQLPEEPLGRARTPMSLNEDVDYVSILVDGTPQVASLASDAHEQLVQVPRIAQTTLSTPQFPSVVSTEFPTPLPDRLVGDDDPALRQQILDVAVAQAEAVIKPGGVTDDLGRESVSVVALQSVAHLGSLPGATSS
jgi:hypothetical protein